LRSVDLEKFQPGAHLAEELMRPKTVFLNAHQLCKRVVARQKLGYSHLEPSEVDKSLGLVADFAEFHGRLRELDLKTEKRGCQLFHSRVRWPLAEVSEPEYAACKNDPKKALSVVYHAKERQVPEKISKDILTILENKLDALFASLPRTRSLTLDTFYAEKGQLPKKITYDVVGNLRTKLDALWKTYEENAYRTDLMPDEEVEHILRLIDAELKGTPEYEACNNDPKKALAVAFNAKQGRETKRIDNDVVINLIKRLDALFASSPRSRSITLSSFYTHNLSVLKMSEPTREKLRKSEVRGSSRLQQRP
jgi:hypothetical protein